MGVDGHQAQNHHQRQQEGQNALELVGEFHNFSPFLCFWGISAFSGSDAQQWDFHLQISTPDRHGASRKLTLITSTSKNKR
jgi:hypothetical protein